MTRVKICGVRTPEAAVAAAQAGADFIGLLFAESKRKLTPQQCHDTLEGLRAWQAERAANAAGRGLAGMSAELVGPTRGEVAPGASWYGAWSETVDDVLVRRRPLVVGVFADQPLHEINDIADAAGVDLVQLSGDESPDFVRKVNRPVIKGLHVRPDSDAMELLEAARDQAAAGLLLDTASDSARGGTGETFDWDIAAEVARRMPFLLAGGLTPETVGDAVSRVDPWGVDVSTGVETDGEKDPEKIRAFIRAAKGAGVGR